jgi:hypothetical protein
MCPLPRKRGGSSFLKQHPGDSATGTKMQAAALSQGTPYQRNTSRNSLFRSSIAEQDQATLFFGRHKLRPGIREMFHSDHDLNFGRAQNILAACAPGNSLDA